MRKLITCLLVLCCFKGIAQESEEDAALMTPRILALDTTLSQANHFNDEIGKLADGYNLAFTDKSRPKTVMQVYKTGNNETLRLEYKYVTGEEGIADGGKPVVNFQKITGDVTIITRIYNYLFNTNIAPDQMYAVSTVGSDISYLGKTHQLILEPDDYSPGYWAITFVR
jgi:mRNA deadenylase 3'-5' endonuclease subunit Ccr4